MLKTITEMVGQGMGDLLSTFNKHSLKKKKLDTARGDHAAFRKVCGSCHFLYDFSSSHKGYMPTKTKSSLICCFLSSQPFSIMKNVDYDESCLQLNNKHKSVVFSEH